MKNFKLWLFHLKSKYIDNSFWDSLNGSSISPISCIRITKGVAIYKCF